MLDAVLTEAKVIAAYQHIKDLSYPYPMTVTITNTLADDNIVWIDASQTWLAIEARDTRESLERAYFTDMLDAGENDD